MIVLKDRLVSNNSRYGRSITFSAKNKKGLDHDVVHSSVFMADMTNIALRSKIQSKRMIQVWFGFYVVILFGDIEIL